MHSMCVKCRARQDGRQQQVPGGGGRRDSMHMAVCVCVCLVGKQGCSRDTMGHLHQKGSKRGCTHGTQVKAGHNGELEITRQKPRQRRQRERVQHQSSDENSRGSVCLCGRASACVCGVLDRWMGEGAVVARWRCSWGHLSILVRAKTCPCSELRCNARQLACQRHRRSHLCTMALCGFTLKRTTGYVMAL